MSREQLTGVIIVHNEQRELGQCLSRWNELCDRIIIVDDASTDQTAQLARHMGYDVIPSQMDEYGFSGLRNRGLEQVDTAMALVFDADERPTPELKSSIYEANLSGDYAYSINRRTHAFGRVIEHGRFASDSQIRLMPSSSRYIGTVHEYPVIDESVELRDIDGYIEHYTYRTLGKYLRKMHRYAHMEADQSGVRPSARIAAMRAPHNFIKEAGYKDGWRGLVMAVGDSWYEWMMKNHETQSDNKLSQVETQPQDLTNLQLASSEAII